MKTVCIFSQRYSLNETLKRKMFSNYEFEANAVKRRGVERPLVYSGEAKLTVCYWPLAVIEFGNNTSEQIQAKLCQNENQA